MAPTTRPSAPSGRRRRALLFLLIWSPLVASPSRALPPEAGQAYGLVGQLMSEVGKERRRAARELIRGRDESLVPGLVDAVFFTPGIHRREILDVLRELTGEEHEGYYEWVEYVGGRTDLKPYRGYPEWKASLLGRIDARYGRIFYPGAPARIRLEEIVSGGVRLAGIPALDRPATVPASGAGYLRGSERVFGVELGGEARAYPLRILSWHELLNDEIGGRPVTLSFCTLCGSGILYDATSAAGGAHTFDTSGLLYRSNKLMVDRETYTLWSNLTGEPVVGRLAASDIRLRALPSTLTTWERWVEEHPATRVLDLAALERQGARHGFVYRPGAADRARAGVSFPVWLRDDRLARDAEVFALRLGAGAKAYPLEILRRRPVVNDELGGEPLVLVTEPESGSVRAYRRGERLFRSAAGGEGLKDERGRLWRVEEGRLRLDGEATEESPLERLAGHVAYWFGWYAFFPQTELFGPEE